MLNLILWRHFLPCVLIVIDVLAAIRYAFDKDWGRVSYWLAAALITASATFWIER